MRWRLSSGGSSPDVPNEIAAFARSHLPIPQTRSGMSVFYMKTTKPGDDRRRSLSDA
jgi:hypothetical protein